jgi:hypothetical protein
MIGSDLTCLYTSGAQASRLILTILRFVMPHASESPAMPIRFQSRIRPMGAMGCRNEKMTNHHAPPND